MSDPNPSQQETRGRVAALPQFAITGKRKNRDQPGFFVVTVQALLGSDWLRVGIGTVNQLDQCHRRIVAIPEAVLQDA